MRNRSRPADDPRWPSILTNIVSTISGANHTAEGEKLAEGKAIITKLSGLKHAMGRNAVLEYALCLASLITDLSRMMVAPISRATMMLWQQHQTKKSAGSR